MEVPLSIPPNSDDVLPDVLRMFGVQLVAPLGGRLNQHWLVASPHERLVLRRWSPSQSPDTMDYEVRLLAQIAALGWPVAPVVEGPIERAGHFWSLSPFLMVIRPPSRIQLPSSVRAGGCWPSFILRWRNCRISGSGTVGGV
jgi:hypothetical protein